MRKKDKLIHGIGINDADYNVYITTKTEGKKKIIWICPFYRCWKNMFKRCYGESWLEQYTTYIGSTVTEEWKYFSNFKAWMEKQDWEYRELDKDILFPGNKIYGPDTCVFVSPRLNTFITERRTNSGEWPVGVYFHKEKSKFKASCWDLQGKRKHLGYFDTPEKAHQAWLDKKIELAYDLASEQSDPRVAAALIDRYENYHTYFGETK